MKRGTTTTTTELAQEETEEDDALLSKKKKKKNNIFKRDPEADVNVNILIAGDVKTQLLQVDKHFFIHHFETPKGDIGYHFEKSDETDKFEEGEIVGFVANKEGKYETVQKLNLQNCVNATIKGVVTRSQYFEAHVPKDNNSVTETICMFGLVPVQVRGPVQVNDALYASEDVPGVAVSVRGKGDSEQELREHRTGFVGIAFEGRPICDETTISLVTTAVSINECTSQQSVNKTLDKVNKKYDTEIDRVRNSGRNFRKIIGCASVILVIICILVGVFIWQHFYPGTKFRYWKCRQGRKKPYGNASFKFVSYSDLSKFVHVNGVEFAHQKLMKKMGFEDIPTLTFNNTSTHYYLNIDRCAHGGIRRSADTSRGLPVVGGANIFSIDGLCESVYFFDAESRRWTRYNSGHVTKCYHSPTRR